MRKIFHHSQRLISSGSADITITCHRVAPKRGGCATSRFGVARLLCSDETAGADGTRTDSGRNSRFRGCGAVSFVDAIIAC